jgi:prepilin-type N-terminal cleavage/methylation domain-containing protein
MKNTRNKTYLKHKHKIRGTCCGRYRDSAARGTKADFLKYVHSRKIRGTCDGPRAHDARRSQADLWIDTKHRDGFTILELLIALSISAILLGAIAVAFNGSIINYQQNESIFRTINNARQALYRMTTQIRTAEAVDPNASSTECSFFTADGENITYEYRSADNKLYLITNSQEYVLCDNVTAMTFTKSFSEDGLYCKSVQISMTVVSGDLQRTISSAAVIRRNLH